MKFNDLIQKLNDAEGRKRYAVLLEYLMDKDTLSKFEADTLLDTIRDYEDLERKQFADVILYKYLCYGRKVGATVEKWFSL
jgi:hypothetical protein